MSRHFFLLAASAVITIFLVLGISRLPGGEPLGAQLAGMATSWHSDSFEQELDTELQLLSHPHLQPMMLQLVMLQITKQAREARHRTVGSGIAEYWQQTYARTTAPADEDAMRALRERSGLSIAGTTLAVPKRQSVGLWGALAGFAFILLWVCLRRV